LAVLVLALAIVGTLATPLNLDVIARNVNNRNTTWKADVNSRFLNLNKDQVKYLTGSLKAPAEKRPPRLTHNLEALQLPDNFDSRTQWPNCPTIAEVRDQSDCGSCWAFGAVEAASDRVCIATQGKLKPHLSARDLLTCCDTCGDGCNGGYPEAAWDYMASTGVVTGGNFGDYTECVAYPFPMCDHHVSGKYGPCPSSEYSTPSCRSSCDSNTTYSGSYAKDKFVFKSSYSLQDEASIKADIYKNGPVEGAFTVYADFLTYKSGVYQNTEGDELGGHAIRILGWGVEDNTPYWLVANSWNEQWGDHGFFKIRRGSDECGIEDGVVAGLYA